MGGFVKLITPETLKRVVFPIHDEGVAEILLIEHGFIIEQSVVAFPHTLVKETLRGVFEKLVIKRINTSPVEAPLMETCSGYAAGE